MVVEKSIFDLKAKRFEPWWDFGFRYFRCHFPYFLRPRPHPGNY
jgi:hypothetical protein